MKEIKLTLQDYKNAINLWNEWQYATIVKSFPKYIEEIIDELEKPETLMYRCIKLPHAINGMFEILGQLYPENYCIAGFNLADLPNHFELVEPESEPEKITWDEVVTLIENYKRKTSLPQRFYIELIKILRRIKTDHLS